MHGGHLIMLGPKNNLAASEAIKAFPGGLQVGGGIDLSNANEWINVGASHVIVTSCLFDNDGRFVLSNLKKLN